MPTNSQDFATMLVAKMQELDNDSTRATNQQQNASQGHKRVDRGIANSEYKGLSGSAFMAIARYGNSSNTRQQSQSIANYTGGDTEESSTERTRRTGNTTRRIDSLSSSLKASEKLKLLSIKKDLQSIVKKYQEIQDTNNEIDYDIIYKGSDIITLSKEAQKRIRKT